MRDLRSRLISLLFVLLFVSPAAAGDNFITLASTTSTQASGLFDYFLPIFTAGTGIEVRVIAAGTGQALKIGENGDADVLLVHDRVGEAEFVREGFGLGRREVMYNDFGIIGPKRDPAGIRDLRDAVAAFRKIAAAQALFLSRGDDSGTHRMERRLWQEAGIDPGVSGTDWYREAGTGMGEVLNMSAGTGAYTLSDRATWLSFKNRADLELLAGGDPRLFNQYGLILVNPARHRHVKAEAAKRFIDWMTSPAGQRTIADFRVEGEPLFFPNASR